MPSGTWALGWITGDVVQASELAKGVGSIYDTTLGGSAATIDITPIVASYAHLRVVLYSRGDVAAVTMNPKFTFNNDSGANYDYQGFVQNNATLTANAAATAQSAAIFGYAPGASATANFFGSIVLDIPHYAGTTNHKSFVAVFGAPTSAAAAGFWNGTYMGRWASTAAINRITIAPSSGNFVTGTRLTIYGMGA